MTAPRGSPEAPQYKGGQLDPARGPGLGCFYLQLVLLLVLVVLTPLSAYARWPVWSSAVLLFATIGLLLLTGQTIIFLLRIVAAERGQRRPLASRSRTVGEIEAASPEPPLAVGTAPAVPPAGASPEGAGVPGAGEEPAPTSDSGVRE